GDQAEVRGPAGRAADCGTRERPEWLGPQSGWEQGSFLHEHLRGGDHRRRAGQPRRTHQSGRRAVR
ncbi:hypothetical protein M9458_044129, partial [Cirrhinus mrigala]